MHFNISLTPLKTQVKYAQIQNFFAIKNGKQNANSFGMCINMYIGIEKCSIDNIDIQVIIEMKMFFELVSQSNFAHFSLPKMSLQSNYFRRYGKYLTFKRDFVPNMRVQLSLI